MFRRGSFHFATGHFAVINEQTNTVSSYSNTVVRSKRIKTQEEMLQMLHLNTLDFTHNRIATLLGCHREMAVRYLE